MNILMLIKTFEQCQMWKKIDFASVNVFTLWLEDSSVLVNKVVQLYESIFVILI